MIQPWNLFPFDIMQPSADDAFPIPAGKGVESPGDFSLALTSEPTNPSLRVLSDGL